MAKPGGGKVRTPRVGVAAPIREHEVEVYLVVSATRNDLYDALTRSGIAPGNLIGEALIQDVQVYPNEGDDDAS